MFRFTTGRVSSRHQIPVIDGTSRRGARPVGPRRCRRPRGDRNPEYNSSSPPADDPAATLPGAARSAPAASISNHPSPAIPKSPGTAESFPRHPHEQGDPMTDSLTIGTPQDTSQPAAPVYRYYAGGEWKDAASGETFESYEPYTGRVFARVAAGGAHEMGGAIDAAHAAFPAWAATPAAVKAALLLKAAEIVKRPLGRDRRQARAGDRQHAAFLAVPARARRRHVAAGRRLGLPAQG